MRDEDISHLLRQADEQFEPELPSSSEIVERVWRLDRRASRRRKALAAATACAVLITASVAWRNWRLDNAAPEQPAVPIAETNANKPTRPIADELDRLTAEADAAFRFAQRMIADRRRSTWRRATSANGRADPIEEVRERLDQVAFRMVREADQLRTDMRPTEESLSIYRNVIRLFPDTPSAHLARERINALGNS